MDPVATPTFAAVRRPELQAKLAELGFTTPTPVQEACLAAGLGQDLVVQARTGSGKTLAFGLPILDAVNPNDTMPQALVLAPTRELALQIAKALSPFAGAIDARCVALTGGADIVPQKKALTSTRGAQLVVGTPGRVLDLLTQRTFNSKHVRTVVLDEGDHLLDMGFKDELDAIMAKIPAERRTLLYSATIPPEVDALAKRHTRDPRKIVIDAAQAHADIEHFAYAVPEGLKAEALANLLFHERPERTVVFCATRIDARELSERLPLLGIPAGLISGELDQHARNRALDAFRAGRCHVLVATDVAARGIDVPATSHVVHFSLPGTHEAYVHRSGRTGRAGRKGIAITLVTARERGQFARIARGANVKPRWKDLPGPALVRRRRIERLAERILAEEATLVSAEAQEQARRLANAKGSLDGTALVARLLDMAAELEGEPGFELAQAIREEAQRPIPRRPSKKERRDHRESREDRWRRQGRGREERERR